jgi:2-hydroxychromene-2-carboxylate isomerase
VPPTAGSSTAEPSQQQPRFYYDFASPESYLVAERALHALDVVPEWIPVGVGEVGPFRCAEEVASYQEDISRRAAALGLMPLSWPDPFPASDTEWALLAATYAKWIGRGVAFSLAALRQAFAAGRDLSVRDNVLIAAAACEMHPAAVVKGAELASTRRALADANARALADGVETVPAIWVDGRVLAGEREIPGGWA